MASQLVEAVWLNDADACSLDELAEYSGLSQAELAELVALGAIESEKASEITPEAEPSRSTAAGYVFRSQTIVVARTARRLRDDFELDIQGLAMALNLLHRIQALEARLAAADARLPHPA
ncbi:MAG: chaperone modulator CbpM [Collimonas sp.]|uniref:chaperone modulator CbpM n=1 Tax=Collimonas sp. TaxID=1963772 RepID=UPI00326760FE